MRGLKRRSFKLRERKENAFLLIISDKYGEEGESPSFVLARICKIFPVIDESLYATINSNLWPIPSDEFVNSIEVFGYLKISKLFNRDTNHFSYNENKCKKAKWLLAKIQTICHKFSRDDPRDPLVVKNYLFRPFEHQRN